MVSVLVRLVLDAIIFCTDCDMSNSFIIIFPFFVELDMKTDEKPTLPRLRIAVLGNKNVGKSGKLIKSLNLTLLQILPW